MESKNKLTERLLKEIWNQKFYYDQTHEFILKAFSYRDKFLIKLKGYTRKADKILECGCGSASVLEKIWYKDKVYYGIDISRFALKLARKRLRRKKNINLSVRNIEKLKFSDNYFDLVYAVSVLEHIFNPEKALKEMVRVTKKGGWLILMSPNYGSPLFPSSCYPKSSGIRLKRFLITLTKSYLYLLRKPKNLDWSRVYPIALNNEEHHSDWDTVTEPYLQTLLIFLRRNRLKILENYSTLQVVAGKVPHELPGKSPLSWLAHFLFRNLSLWVERIGLPPYCYFGPNFFVAAKKE